MDLELRELERRALAGDAEAALRFVALHRRTLPPEKWLTVSSTLINRSPYFTPGVHAMQFTGRLNEAHIHLTLQISAPYDGIFQILAADEDKKLILAFTPDFRMQGEACKT